MSPESQRPQAAAIEEAGSGLVRVQVALACTYSPELVQGFLCHCGFIKEGDACSLLQDSAGETVSPTCRSHVGEYVNDMAFHIQCLEDGASLRCGALVQCTT